jgi:Clp amino terminal domain, pathogenicity island component/SnoaL-like domain
MFERYTEKARRVIFFARYEASQYGSPVIDTEHLLLGLVREDVALMRYAGPIPSSTEIRTDIERAIQRGDPMPTSAELPLSTAAKRVLNFAGEEADRFGHRHIGTEHILLAIFRLPDSLAARILVARGAKPNAIREQLAKGSTPPVPSTRPLPDALITLNTFIEVLKEGASGKLPNLFHDTSQFIDSNGERWLGRPEIEKGAETLLAPFAKRNAIFRVEDTTAGPSQTFIASVLWEFAAASADRSKSMLRMSIVLAWADEEWTILLVQMTPVV